MQSHAGSAGQEPKRQALPTQLQETTKASTHLESRWTILR